MCLCHNLQPRSLSLFVLPYYRTSSTRCISAQIVWGFPVCVLHEAQCFREARRTTGHLRAAIWDFNQYRRETLTFKLSPRGVGFTLTQAMLFSFWLIRSSCVAYAALFAANPSAVAVWGSVTHFPWAVTKAWWSVRGYEFLTCFSSKILISTKIGLYDLDKVLPTHF